MATRRLYAVEELKSNSIFFLLSHLVAVHLPELGSIQRLKHVRTKRGAWHCGVEKMQPKQGSVARIWKLLLRGI